MRPLKGVFAAKCSDRWIGFRSPVSSANPTTSDDLTVLAYLSVIPTCKSSKYKVCRGRSVTAIPSTRYAGRLESVSQHWPFAPGFLSRRVECRPLVSGPFPTDTGAPAAQTLPAFSCHCERPPDQVRGEAISGEHRRHAGGRLPRRA